MNLRRILAIVPTLLGATLSAQTPTPAATDVRARAILEEGLERSQVMQLQDELCHQFGSRLTGSLAFDRAAEWARDRFRAMGLDAQLEPWGEWQVGWDREQWMGRMIAPEALELQVACPAWTGPTRGIARGTLVPMPETTEELDALSARAGQDAALWLYGPLPRSEELRPRLQELLDTGQVLGVVQSATSTRWNDKRFENQIRVFGDRNAPLRPFEDRQRWPHAIVRDDQAAHLERALAGDADVVVEFELRNRFRRGPVTLHNVVADLVGTERPDEVVIVCAHLDSWHQATGATDNGTGTCTTLEAARILTAVGCRPRRTIRFILWGGEEQGLLGSRQYVVMNRTRMHKVAAVFNHDSGTNWAQGLTVAESQAADFRAILAPLLDAVQPPQADFEGPVFALDVKPVLEPAGGGSDHASFGAVGVPAYSWRLRGEVPYARGWHSQWDTWSIVVPEYQRHTATVVALVAAGIADLDHMLSREGVERAQPDRRRGRVDAQLIVETWLGVELDGTTITAVGPDGMANAAGLEPGDVLRAIGDTEVTDAPELLAALRSAFAAADRAPARVERDGTALTLPLRR